MAYVVVATLVAAVLTLVVGAVLGRLQARTSCAVADPRRDLRMRSTYDEGNEGRPDAARAA